MDDLVRKLLSVAEQEDGRISRVRVRLGALSHFTPEHFREHFEDATRGTRAEGAAVEATVANDPADPQAMGVVLDSIDFEEV